MIGNSLYNIILVACGLERRRFKITFTSVRITSRMLYHFFCYGVNSPPYFWDYSLLLLHIGILFVIFLAYFVIHLISEMKDASFSLKIKKKSNTSFRFLIKKGSNIPKLRSNPVYG